LNPAHDEFNRFAYGVPPAKNGDFAFLLHIVTSLKSTGHGAVILPHGVLFRGNAEAVIRTNLVKRGLIRGIIGLPPNLFYGTGIPACIVVIDKQHAATRDGVFMIDASRGFIKDGNKNRLRAQDIHRIVDLFTRQTEVPGYARRVPLDEIAANDYNLNLPRYIDASEPEDLHDLEAHLKGGIPVRDIDAIDRFWRVFPRVRAALFEPARPGYSRARLPAREVKPAILNHADFHAFAEQIGARFEGWRAAHEPALRAIGVGDSPKALIHDLSEDLLRRFADAPLLDPYDLYQRLMDYWAETMQDDVYILAQDGWRAGRTLRPAHDGETPDFSVKKGQKSVRYVGELIPAALVIERFFAEERSRLDALEAQLEETAQRLAELEEEHGGDEGIFNGLEGARGGIAKANVQDRVIELREMILPAFPEHTAEHKQATQIKKTTFVTEPWQRGQADADDLFAELDVLHHWLRLSDEVTKQKKALKAATAKLYAAVVSKYPALADEEIRQLVVGDKWLAAIAADIRAEVERVTQRLAGRVQALEERYAEPLPSLVEEVAVLAGRVDEQLRAMGVVWN
jgi:type I restriction enzyme M protein